MILAALAAAAVAAAPPPAFSCSAGYRRLAGRLTADHSLLQDPPTADRPWRELRTPDDTTPQWRFSIAMPGAEGYPAVVRRKLTRQGGALAMDLTVCCWASARECRFLKQDSEAGDVRMQQTGATQ